MIWVKNEGLVWWLLLVGALALRCGPRVLGRLRQGGRWTATVNVMAVVGVVVPGMMTTALWWGWRRWHGLADGDFSFDGMTPISDGGKMEAFARTAEVVQGWMFGDGLGWHFGGVWWVAGASLLWLGWRHRKDGVAGWLLLVCAGGALMPLMVFPFSTVEPLDRHLVAVWRLIWLPSAAALLLVARLWGRARNLGSPDRQEQSPGDPDPLNCKT